MSIRPAYRFGRFVGFCLHNGAEPIGRVYPLYKQAALALVQL